MSGARSARRVFSLAGICLSALLAATLIVLLVVRDGDPLPAEPAKSIVLDDGTRLAYVRGGTGQPMIAVHGSPGSKSDFSGLMPELANEYEIYAFDMPGFGESSDWVADYGYEAAADYLAEAVVLLGLDEVIVTGFSWGGGVAIAFAARYPELTSTLLLVAAVGVSDGFHTGRHWSEYLRSLLAAPSLFLYPGPLAGGVIPFADRYGFWRGFVDSDSRAIERMLAQIEDPAVIVHGNHDSVVGPAGARRHYELIPDSTLYFYDGSHGWIYREFAPLANAIREAFDAAE